MSAIFRWVLTAGVAAAAVLLRPEQIGTSLFDFLLYGSLLTLIGLSRILGVKITSGRATFVPAIVMMALMTVGIRMALALSASGIALAGLIEMATVWRRRKAEGAGVVSSELVALPLALNGLSLLAVALVTQGLGDPLPLRRIGALEDLLPVIMLPVVYLLVYNIILVIDLLLRRLPILKTLVDNRRTILGIQLLPMVPVPFSALVLSNQGTLVFLIFELILGTIIIVINRLTVAQESLSTQISQLRTFSTMNRALRTTLNIDDLMQTTYYQVANLVGIKNIHIVLSDNLTSEQTVWKTRLVVDGGKMQRGDETRPVDGLILKVLENRVALVGDPIENEARRLNISDLPPRTRAWMGVPLLAAGKAIGCVAVWIGEGELPDRILDEADLDLLAAITGQTSVALENAFLYREAQEQASQLEQLNQISTVMNASLNPIRVMELIADSVVEISGCDKTAIYLTQPGGASSHLLLVHSKGFAPENLLPVKDANLTLTEAHREKLLEKGERLVVGDIEAVKAEMSPGLLLLAEQEKFRSYAYLPLRAQNQSIGMLAVYYIKPHTFRPNDLELLETFANQAALAIVNARIYQEVDVELGRRVEQSMHMAEITRRLSSTLDLRTIFHMIVETAMDGCGADAGLLVLNQDPDNLLEDADEELTVVAWKGFDPEKTQRAPHRVAEGLASQVLSSGETKMTAVDDPEDLTGPHSQMSVPVIVDNRTIGAIALESERISAFSDDDVSFVGQLAVQASVAIRNAQLYRKAQQVRDRLHAILDSSNDGLMMIDPHSRITMTNTRMGDFWDFARQDFSQRTPDQFLADPLTALGEGLGYAEGELNALLAEGLRNPHMRGIVDLYEARAGSRTRYVERVASPVYDDTNRFIGLLLLFRDVTQQKELEQAREDLTNMIVHDLRAPLQSIMGGMQAIERVIPKGDKVIEQATDISERATKRLLNLVNNLLDMSRMQGGELKINPRPTNLKGVLDEAAGELRPLAQEANALIEIELGNGRVFGHVDRDMIGRVVLNLLDNALKYAPPGSIVSLWAGPDDGTKNVRVQVVDRGPGIPDEYKVKIFDRFSQIPGQTGRRRSSGLGLAFCQMAVEAHRGKIWVEDNPDGGSVFCFTVPAAAPPDDDDEDEVAAKPAAKKSGRGRPGEKGEKSNSD